MARCFSLKNKSFTLLETTVAIFIFLLAITIVSQIYINLVRAAIYAQNLQLSLDNVRLGIEKIWNEIKVGSDFSFPTNDSISFKDRRCRDVKIYKENNNLIFELATKTPFFDPQLVKLVDFKIYHDNPSQGAIYYISSNKVIVFEYIFELNPKTDKIPLSFRQTVAPLNSFLFNKPCL